MDWIGLGLDASEFLWQRIGNRSPVLLFEVHLHALEAKLVGGNNIVDDNSFRHVLEELGGVELVVGSGGGNDLGLFLDGEILVFVGGIDVLCVQIQDLVVRNDTGVGKVVDTLEALLGHGQGGGEHLGQDGHRVGNVDDALVLDNLGNERAVDEIVRDGHADPQNQAVGVLLEHGFHVSLGFAVKGSVKVGNVLLGKADSGSLGVLFVVHKDATGGVDGAVNVSLETQIGQIQGSDDVGSDGFGLVRFAPIDVGTAGDAGGVQDVRGLVFVQLLGNGLAVLETAVGGLDLDAP